IFINAGLVGLGLWLLFHVAVLKRLWTGDVSESALMDRGAAIALWTSLLVFGLPYSPPTEHGFMMGMIGAIAAQSMRTGLRDRAEPRDIEG
ncbi:MAG: hypothetical protein AB7G39_02200, partial [Alphaproteobacteria bacterium]